ncbi:sulfotransferase [Natronosporangium hydrolyticum]|uniref:Sulfotransferase n=1 Tax=Natronosporangium hydrolyticum TaxID=2811111 RepID=A0A895YGL0_9ACTN|nr:sulfotransferase family protein [Natronosporangium hydrolyticum]QSB16701.1 sulfotransferase [Natronosporangium hydrolyticum]
MPLQIIGAGWGRTGTASMRAALEQLGYSCHHMLEVIAEPAQAALFTEALDDPDFDWERIYHRYTATMDWPGSVFWRELAAAYPQAKVLLTVRDPEKWYDSFRSTIYQGWLDGVRDHLGEGWLAMRRRVLVERCFDGRPEDREHAIAAYLRHNQQVQAEVPAERLLVYKPGEGWPRLCEFLGVPEPAEPFPHVNDRAEFIERG